MKFTKMHGCGNDYIYVNGFEEHLADPSEVARRISPRHFGVGSDGMIIIGPSDAADFKMSMYNLDGSEGKMCGNGIRCLGKYVYDNKMTDKTRITVETLSGIKTLEMNVSGGKVSTVKVDMGIPVFDPSEIPVISDKDRVVNEPVRIGGRVWNITCISMGNPHAVVIVDDTASLKLDEIGPLFENNTMFPERINTEFVQILSRQEIRMRVWERGSGETYACGTGACASAAACVLNDLTDRHVLVHLLGGNLTIDYEKDGGPVIMTGPAVTVYTGEIDV